MAIHECFPYLRVSDGDAAIDWYCAVLGGTEKLRLVDPTDGRVGHAEIALGGDMVLMLSAAYPEMNILAPTGNTGCSIHLHVDDADALIARAAEHGAKVVREASDQFYGERSGSFEDPYGHTWMVGHHLEDVEPTEMQRRWNEMAG